MSNENQHTDNIGQLIKAKTSSLQRPYSSLAQRGLQELIRLRADPEVGRLVSVVRDSSSWDARCAAWQQLRKMGPERKGWGDAMKDLIYSSDGWGRIFAAESLACHSSSPDDAIPVLVATLSVSIENHSYDWARVACGAIGKYRNLKPSLKEIAIPALMLALECQDYNVSGYAAETLSSFGKDAVGAIPKIVAVANSKEE